MGVILNSVNNQQNLETGLDKLGSRFGIHNKNDNTNTIALNISNNLNNSSKTCPVISECKDLCQRIGTGDFRTTALNGGLLALYAVHAGGVGGS